MRKMEGGEKKTHQGRHPSLVKKKRITHKGGRETTSFYCVTVFLILSESEIDLMRGVDDCPLWHGQRG